MRWKLFETVKLYASKKLLTKKCMQISCVCVLHSIDLLCTEFLFSVIYIANAVVYTQLTGKKFCAIPGPPGIPSLGGSWPSGLGAGPAFWKQKRITGLGKRKVEISQQEALCIRKFLKVQFWKKKKILTCPIPLTPYPELTNPWVV